MPPRALSIIRTMYLYVYSSFYIFTFHNRVRNRPVITTKKYWGLCCIMDMDNWIWLDTVYVQKHNMCLQKYYRKRRVFPQSTPLREDGPDL